MRTSDVRERLARVFSERPTVDDAPQLVVWDDPEGEFADQVEGLLPEGVELVRDEEGARFAAKRRVNELGAGDRALLYRQRAASDVHGDWFADAVLYARHFQADLVSVQLEELGCADTREMRQALRGYRAFLHKKTNLKRLRALCEHFETPNDLHMAVMATVLGKDVVARYDTVLVAYLCRAREEGADAVLGALEAAGAADAFRTMCADATGYTDDLSDAEALVRHILLTALSFTMDRAALKGLERWISVAHAQLCHGIVRAWAADPDRADELEDAARAVEEACNLPARFESLGVADLARADGFPCISEAIALNLLHSVAAGADVAADIRLAYDARRTLPWFGEVASYYEALLAVADLQQLYRAHANGFHAAQAADLWGSYTALTDGLFRVDAAYRRFNRAFERALQDPNIQLDDALKGAATKVEHLYKNWFLHDLDACWFDRAEQGYQKQGYVNDVPRLGDFYMTYVESLARHGKVFVIASDALRYEVAAELAERLERETKGRVELASMQAPFPSVTALGMASLLPHGALALSCEDGAISVEADGLPTRSVADRQSVLRVRETGAVAVQQERFVAMRRDERRALTKDANVVYIFHNAIDAVGDDAKTENDVFEACDKAQDEIMALVKIITGELRASNVVITADHGFLYTREPLGELDHAVVELVEGEPVKVARRYVLAGAGARPDLLMPVAMGAQDAGGLTGFTPRGSARIRRQGAGENYVHGGLTLQEVCVPVLRFKNLRAGSAAYEETEPVEIQPLGQSDLITNTLFRIGFFQAEPVGGKRLACTYELCVEDFSGNAVSDVATVVADRTSPEAAERELSASFALKAGVAFSAGETYYLVARRAETGVIAWRHQVRIEVAFAPAEDFDW